LRYADAANHQANQHEYSMGKEIEEMFDDMMEPLERQKYFTTFKGRKES
jgi:hypothetical protein